ncbi:hypothetical protein BVRB_8g187770 [Beta vulgaris subsp. vulgaris]|uniref:Uncharacterized protein n=1 Tax=Beta vulgaris subsp. vulgaris TaxID=3555 RepID=A0A0J8BV86_BETVV|nr:hypothetical protein BVRB_8g187770 [Beta vulgaris subsp. vulgaris]
MGSVMAATAQMQASQEANHRAVTATLAGIRTDLDHVSRVAWRTHLANVYSGHEPPFPNHPHYPPSFDPREGPFEEPSFRPYPHYPSFYPDGFFSLFIVIVIITIIIMAIAVVFAGPRPKWDDVIHAG